MSRAQLFREAKNGNLYLELVERFGQSDLHENFTGPRKVVGTTANSLKLEKNGKVSYLDLGYASLMEYSNDELIVYNPGYREMTQDEMAVMEEWFEYIDNPEFRDLERADLMSDGSSTYYMKKRFFTERGFEQLLGFDFVRGSKIDFNRFNDGDPQPMIDYKVKGEPILIYKVTRKDD